MTKATTHHDYESLLWKVFIYPKPWVIRCVFVCVCARAHAWTCVSWGRKEWLKNTTATIRVAWAPYRAVKHQEVGGIGEIETRLAHADLEGLLSREVAQWPKLSLPLKIISHFSIQSPQVKFTLRYCEIHPLWELQILSFLKRDEGSQTYEWLRELKGEMDSNIIRVGDFNNSPLIMDRTTSRRSMRKQRTWKHNWTNWTWQKYTKHSTSKEQHTHFSQVHMGHFPR